MQMDVLEQVSLDLVGFDVGGVTVGGAPPRQMFGRDSYLKGAVFFHRLRREMGDEAFFQGLRAYLDRYGGRTATDADFQAVMEEAAGKSLEKLFAKWLR